MHDILPGNPLLIENKTNNNNDDDNNDNNFILINGVNHDNSYTSTDIYIYNINYNKLKNNLNILSYKMNYIQIVAMPLQNTNYDGSTVTDGPFVQPLFLQLNNKTITNVYLLYMHILLQI